MNTGQSGNQYNMMLKHKDRTLIYIRYKTLTCLPPLRVPQLKRQDNNITSLAPRRFIYTAVRYTHSVRGRPCGNSKDWINLSECATLWVLTAYDIKKTKKNPRCECSLSLALCHLTFYNQKTITRCSPLNLCNYELNKPHFFIK